jgi:hypothetical protein
LAGVGGHEFLVAIAPHEYDRLTVIDVGRSLHKVVLHATRMGLATCWIGPGADHQSVIRHLGDRFDPQRDHIICVCAVGYKSHFVPLFVRLMRIMQHTRLPLDRLFFADPDLSKPLDLRVAPYAAVGRCFEVCQWSPSDPNSQTTRCMAAVAPIAANRTLTRFDVAAATAPRYYAPVAPGTWCANWETGCEALGVSGHFAVLAPEQRHVANPPTLPRYDVRFMLDAPMEA